MNKKLLIKMMVIFIGFTRANYPPSGAMHNVAVDFQGTFSILGELSANFCNPTAITSSAIGTSGYTINSSGNYRLVDDVTFSPGATGQAMLLSI